jgi:hypothetical protein
MKSRRSTILSLAANRSERLIEAVSPSRPRARERLESIHSICALMVSASPSILPTAKLVSEEGRISNRTFPSEQTIHNSYREMLGIWRTAHRDLHLFTIPIDASVEEQLERSAHLFDHGAATVILEARRYIQELTRRNNALKSILHHDVPLSLSQRLEEVDNHVNCLVEWLHLAHNSGFIDAASNLRVTRSTPLGTLIMERRVVNAMHGLTELLATLSRASHQID